ncbi:MAG: restriction endonuclease subunit S [Gammaproteobacteria bacterium]|nr:restriction endonuclease subunit S [Gammaproteobacteria bacterium]
MNIRRVPQPVSVESSAPSRIDTDSAKIDNSIAADLAEVEDLPDGYKHTKVGVMPEDWEIASVEELFTFERTASNSRSELDDSGSVAYVHYGDLHTRFNHFIDVSHAQLPHLSESENVTATLLRNGDLVVADASEDEIGVGKSAEIRNVGSKKAISGLHTFLLRPKDRRICHGYGGYLLENEAVKQQIRRLATGLKVFGISKGSFAQVLIPLPPFSQQRAIAQALLDVDSEITALEQRCEKTRAIKRGMMQQLLTGQVLLA